ncbi:MAG: M20 family metallopeptidase [Candidatus Thorarchaeota archaeon]|jgi:acetylornithine deacetylase
MSFGIIEKKVLDRISEKRVVKLASDFIRFPSFPGEETEAALYLADYLEKGGFGITKQEVEPGRFQPLATLEGTKDGASLLFNGHMDIDPIPRGEQDPFKPRMIDGYLYGAGLYNMKAGVTAMVAAATAIAEAGIELAGNLYCNPVVGELQGGIGTHHTIQHGPKPDAVLIPEPTKLSLLLKHGGVLDVAITTLGKSSHISRREGSIDAIKKMWRIQQALYEMDEKRNWTFEFDSDTPKHPMLNIGSIIGGRGKDWDLQGPYDVADVCTLFVDARINSSQSLESVKNDFLKVLDQLKRDDPELEYEIHFPPELPRDAPKDERIAKVIGLYMPPFNMPNDEYLVQRVVKRHESIMGDLPVMINNDGGGMYSAVYAGTDAFHYWNRGIPAFCYGPGGERPPGHELTHHPPVLVSEIVNCAKVLALTALDICTLSKEEYQQCRSGTRI